MSTGLSEFLTIDSVDLELNPETINAEPIEQVQDILTHGDSVRFHPLIAAGLPVRDIKYRFRFPYGNISDDDVARVVRRLAARHGTRTFAMWRPVNVYYVATAGQVAYYLPRRRRNAPDVVGKSTTEFPVQIWVDGVAQTVAYVAGPGVSTPASGNANVAKAAKTSGTYEDYVEFRLEAAAGGEVVDIEFYPLFLVRASLAAESFPETAMEARELVLEER